MQEKRHTFTFYGFLILNFLVVILSLTFDIKGNPFKNSAASKSDNEPLQESFFKSVNYYLFQKGQNSLHLDADELTINQTTGKTYFFNPRGEAYTKSNKEILYSGKQGVHSKTESILKIDGNVSLKLEDTKGTSDHLKYFIAEEKRF